MIKRGWISASLLAGVLFTGLGITAFATDVPQASAAGNTGDSVDVSLSDRVETLLRTDAGLVGGQFRVQSKAGVVILAGSVPDEQALRRALDLASSVKGVREVRNSMVIESPK